MLNLSVARLFTSSMQGEVDVRAKRGRQVRGRFLGRECSKMPSHPARISLRSMPATLSPHRGKGKKASER